MNTHTSWPPNQFYTNWILFFLWGVLYSSASYLDWTILYNMDPSIRFFSPNKPLKYHFEIYPGLFFFCWDIFIWNMIRCCIRALRNPDDMCITLLNLLHFQNATNQLKVMYLQHSSIPCVFNLQQCLGPFVLILRTICKHFILKWVLPSLMLAELLVSFSNWRRNSRLSHAWSLWLCWRDTIPLFIVELERLETKIVPVLCFGMGPKWSRRPL